MAENCDRYVVGACLCVHLYVCVYLLGKNNRTEIKDLLDLFCLYHQVCIVTHY